MLHCIWLLIICLFLGHTEGHVLDPQRETDIPVELVDKNFTSYLQTAPTTDWVLIEYYAHWCPHCQHFRPTYEQISSYFARTNAQPHVIVARVDCANEGKLCNTFGIRSYPTLRFARPAELLSMDPKQSTDVAVKNRTIEGIVNWVSGFLNGTAHSEAVKQMLSTVEQPQQTAQQGTHGKMQANAAGGAFFKDPKQVDMVDLEAATVLSMHYLLSTSELLQGPEARTALKDWLHLLKIAHPIKKCRKGAGKAHDKLHKYWPPASKQPNSKLLTLHVCGKKSKADDDKWQQCKGSVPNSRGYTCGLWLLFHTLSTRVPQGVGGPIWMAGITGYVRHFFQCAQCAQHFQAMVRMSDPGAVRSRKDVVLWMWERHNQVNARLATEELQWGDRDPAYPKAPWPPVSLCPKCVLQGAPPGAPFEIVWDQDEVYKFMMKYFGAGGSAHDGDAKDEVKAGDSAKKHNRKANLAAVEERNEDDTTEDDTASQEAGRLWQAFVLVTLVAFVLYIMCGCGDLGAPPKPTYSGHRASNGSSLDATRSLSGPLSHRASDTCGHKIPLPPQSGALTLARLHLSVDGAAAAKKQ